MADKYFRDLDDVPAKRQTSNTAFQTILKKRLSKRKLLENTALAALAIPLSAVANDSQDVSKQTSLSFDEIPHGLDEHLHLAKNYSAQVG